MASQLLINEHPLQVLPSLATAIGLNEAIVLQQVHYWLNPRFNKNFFEGQHWVHNTYEKWKQQFPFWSERTVKRTVMSLEEYGLLVSFITRDFKKTKYYTIDYDRLNQIKFVDSHDSVVAETPQNPDLGHNFQETEKTLQTKELQSSGQNGPLVVPSCPDRSGQIVRNGSKEALPNPLNVEEIQGSYPSCQIIPIDQARLSRSIRSSCPSPSGQIVPIDRAKLARSHTETTSETTTEITLPPLLPPPVLKDSACEEMQEEEKNKNLKTKNTKSPLTHSLIKIWNETVQSKIHARQEVYLTEHREKLLARFVETVLRDRKNICLSNGTENWQTDGWQNYCNLIAKSRFLTGNNASGFKVTLDWALMPHNAYKILEGAIFDKPEPASLQNQLQVQPVPWEEFAQEIAKKLPPSPYAQKWVQISQHLAKALGQVRYKSWFSKVYLGNVTETTATLYVEGRFTKAYIDNNFSRDILCSIQTLYPTVKSIDFQLVPSTGE
jgi:hypothetical protein